MRITTTLMAAFAAVFPFQASFAAETTATTGEIIQSDIVYIDLPIGGDSHGGKCPGYLPPPPGGYPATPVDQGKVVVHTISYGDDDSILWNNVNIPEADFNAKLKSDLVPNGLNELHILPTPQVRTASVLDVLRRIRDADFPCYGFSGNGRYRQIWKPETQHRQPWPDNSINLLNIKTPIAIQVISTDSQGRELHDPEFEGASVNGRCRLYFDGEPVSSDELVNLAQNEMEDGIDKAGGMEKIEKGDFELSDLPQPVILTTSNIPWRCVGGTIINLNMAGFLRVGVTLMPEI